MLQRSVTMRPRQCVGPFHLLSKPTGATCNLDCKYCFFFRRKCSTRATAFVCPTNS